MTLGLIAVLIFASLGLIRAQDSDADSGVSFQTFYDQLASQGQWIQTDQYGYVFQPTESDPNWRPYTYGHWVNTDQGMTWVSDEPFGWATDHYGRWTNLDGYGWVWVPGYTWAPAWVSWRENADDVGWAPLPPDSDNGIDYYDDDDDYYTNADWGYGFHIGDDCDLAYGIGPWWYNFCPIAYIGDRDCWRHFHDRRDNFGFIRGTRNVTNINYSRRGADRFSHVRVEGPSVAALNERAHNRIPTAQLDPAVRRSEAGLHGTMLSVFAPRINPATAHTARPDSVAQRLTSTTVNRGTDINHPLAVNSRVASPAATAAQIHAATLASSTSAASARVATDGTHFTRTMSQPLTSLRAGTRTTRTFDAAISRPSVYSSNRFGAPAVSARSSFASRAYSRSEAPVFHNSPSAFAGEAYHSPSVTTQRFTPTFRSYEPTFHSAPFYHPQESFHSFAPAQHFSSGSFGGARSSGGGGFSGGGHVGGGFSGVGRR